MHRLASLSNNFDLGDMPHQVFSRRIEADSHSAAFRIRQGEAAEQSSETCMVCDFAVNP
jgi:hypothetical protein